MGYFESSLFLAQNSRNQSPNFYLKIHFKTVLSIHSHFRYLLDFVGFGPKPHFSHIQLDLEFISEVIELDF